MHLIYIDESGNTGARKDPEQPIHLIAGLCVHESRIRPIEEAVQDIVRKHFGVLILSPGFEIHAADLFGGNGFFKGIAPNARIACVHDILEALALNEAKVIWAAVDKIKLYNGRHPHQMAFLFLVERVEDWLRAPDASLGLLVADENKEMEQKLIEDLDLYKRGGTSWGWRPTQIGSIVDSIHFVQSQNNKLIQCVDVVAYFTLKRYRQDLQLYSDFTAAPPAGIAYLDWREGQFAANHKKRAIQDIGRRLDAITINTKIWP